MFVEIAIKDALFAENQGVILEIRLEHMFLATKITQQKIFVLNVEEKYAKESIT